MTAFAKYICWKPASLGLIAAEAVDTSVPMFLATHQPVRCWGSFYGRPATKKLADELDVLEHLEAPRTENLIIPIIGSTGTGKSHLVRWLRYHVARADGRHIIYVPRDKTSLADVIELILDSVPDDIGQDLTDRIENLRQDLRRASGIVSDDELRRRVLQNVVLAVRRLNPEASPYTNAKDQDYWRFLVGVLPRMLGDPVIEDGFVAEDGVVARIAARISKGRSGDESGHEPLFEPEDLYPEIQSLGRAGQDARMLYDRLRRGVEPRLAEVACELLNGVVEGAVSSLMGLADELGRPRLMSIMVELRRALHRSGNELVLLVEDLAVLHGIQQQLLEALIQPLHSDAGDLCLIRAAMAVTSGVWATLERTVDTLASRIENWNCRIYDLDVEIDDTESGVSHEHTRAFVAGYLNAVRLGGPRLKKEYDRHREGDGPFSAPSACADCKYRDDCHAAFDGSGERGLYPLNDVAADRLVEIEASGANGRFEPRKIVNSLRRVLELAEDDIPASRFPSEALRDHFAHGGNAMSAALAHALRERDPKDADRRRALLELWGPKPYALRDLEPGIHTAFAIPPLGIEGAVVPELEDEVEDITVDPEVRKRQAQRQRVLDQIEAWGRKERRLEQGQARTLRQLVYEAILANVDFESLSVGPSDDLLREIGFPAPAACISIEEAWASDTRAPANALLIEIPQSEESSRLLSALVQFRTSGDWKFPHGSDALVFVSNAVSSWAREVEDRLVAKDGEWALDRAFSLQLLAMTARVLTNAPPSVVNAETTLDSALASYELPEIEGRSREWQALVRSCFGRTAKSATPTSRDDLLQGLVRRVGRSQGGGAPVAIDSADLVDAATRFAKEAALPPDTVTLPTETKSWFAEIESNLEKAPQKELARLREWKSLVDEQIPSTTEFTSLADEIESALDAIAKAGQGHGSDAAVRIALGRLRSVDDSAFGQLMDALETVAGSESTSELLTIVGPDHSSVVDATRELILRADAYFDLIEREIAEGDDASGVREGVGTLAATALAAIDDELQRLLDILEPG